MTGRKSRPRNSGAERLGLFLGGPTHEARHQETQAAAAPGTSTQPLPLAPALQPEDAGGWDDGGGLEPLPLPTLPAGLVMQDPHQQHLHAPWSSQSTPAGALQASADSMNADGSAGAQTQHHRPSITSQAASAGHPARAAMLLSGRRRVSGRVEGGAPRTSGVMVHTINPAPIQQQQKKKKFQGVTKHVQSASAPAATGQEAIPAHLRLRSRVSALQRGFEALWESQVGDGASRPVARSLPVLSDSERNRPYPNSLSQWGASKAAVTANFQATVGCGLEANALSGDMHDWHVTRVMADKEAAIEEAAGQILAARRARKSSVMRRVEAVTGGQPDWRLGLGEDLGPLGQRVQPRARKPPPVWERLADSGPRRFKNRARTYGGFEEEAAAAVSAATHRGGTGGGWGRGPAPPAARNVRGGSVPLPVGGGLMDSVSGPEPNAGEAAGVASGVARGALVVSNLQLGEVPEVPGVTAAGPCNVSPTSGHGVAAAPRRSMRVSHGLAGLGPRRSGAAGTLRRLSVLMRELDARVARIGALTDSTDSEAGGGGVDTGAASWTMRSTSMSTAPQDLGVMDEVCEGGEGESGERAGRGPVVFRVRWASGSVKLAAGRRSIGCDGASWRRSAAAGARSGSCAATGGDRAGTARRGFQSAGPLGGCGADLAPLLLPPALMAVDEDDVAAGGADAGGQLGAVGRGQGGQGCAERRTGAGGEGHLDMDLDGHRAGKVGLECAGDASGREGGSHVTGRQPDNVGDGAHDKADRCSGSGHNTGREQPSGTGGSTGSGPSIDVAARAAQWAREQGWSSALYGVGRRRLAGTEADGAAANGVDDQAMGEGDVDGGGRMPGLLSAADADAGGSESEGGWVTDGESGSARADAPALGKCGARGARGAAGKHGAAGGTAKGVAARSRGQDRAGGASGAGRRGGRLEQPAHKGSTWGSPPPKTAMPSQTTPAAAAGWPPPFRAGGAAGVRNAEAGASSTSSRFLGGGSDAKGATEAATGLAGGLVGSAGVDAHEQRLHAGAVHEVEGSGRRGVIEGMGAESRGRSASTDGSAGWNAGTRVACSPYPLDASGRGPGGSDGDVAAAGTSSAYEHADGELGTGQGRVDSSVKAYGAGTACTSSPHGGTGSGHLAGAADAATYRDGGTGPAKRGAGADGDAATGHTVLCDALSDNQHRSGLEPVAGGSMRGSGMGHDLSPAGGQDGAAAGGVGTEDSKAHMQVEGVGKDGQVAVDGEVEDGGEDAGGRALHLLELSSPSTHLLCPSPRSRLGRRAGGPDDTPTTPSSPCSPLASALACAPAPPWSAAGSVREGVLRRGLTPGASSSSLTTPRDDLSITCCASFTRTSTSPAEGARATSPAPPSPNTLRMDGDAADMRPSTRGFQAPSSHTPPAQQPATTVPDTRFVRYMYCKQTGSVDADGTTAVRGSDPGFAVTSTRVRGAVSDSLGSGEGQVGSRGGISIGMGMAVKVKGHTAVPVPPAWPIPAAGSGRGSPAASPARMRHAGQRGVVPPAPSPPLSSSTISPSARLPAAASLPCAPASPPPSKSGPLLRLRLGSGDHSAATASTTQVHEDHSTSSHTPLPAPAPMAQATLLINVRPSQSSPQPTPSQFHQFSLKEAPAHDGSDASHEGGAHRQPQAKPHAHLVPQASPPASPSGRPSTRRGLSSPPASDLQLMAGGGMGPVVQAISTAQPAAQWGVWATPEPVAHGQPDHERASPSAAPGESAAAAMAMAALAATAPTVLTVHDDDDVPAGTPASHAVPAASWKAPIRADEQAACTPIPTFPAATVAKPTQQVPRSGSPTPTTTTTAVHSAGSSTQPVAVQALRVRPVHGDVTCPVVRMRELPGMGREWVSLSVPSTAHASELPAGVTHQDAATDAGVLHGSKSGARGETEPPPPRPRMGTAQLLAPAPMYEARTMLVRARVPPGTGVHVAGAAGTWHAYADDQEGAQGW